MRGGRKQRHHNALIALWVTVLLLAGCGSRQSGSDDTLYLQATADLKSGDFKAALNLAEKGSAAWRDQPQNLFYWKYRVINLYKKHQ